MSLDPVSSARLQNVMPWLALQVSQMADILALDSPPIKLVVSAGLRTWSEQNALYAQGRTTPGKVVTNAQGGYSWHNFGVAVDCAPEVIAGAIDWNAAHPQWQRMEAVGVSLGLTSGANWVRLVDAPHFQYTGRFAEAVPDDEARQILANEGMEAFWMEVSP